jgi:hypothetical protein
MVYLGGVAAVHVRIGTEQRRNTAVHLGEILTAAVASVLVAVVAGRSVVLGANSNTHAFGLETLTATLWVVAGLSAVLLLSASFRRGGDERTGARTAYGRVGLLLVHVVAALLVAGTLLLLEYLTVSRQAIPDTTTGGNQHDAIPLQRVAESGSADTGCRIDPSNRVLGVPRS